MATALEMIGPRGQLVLLTVIQVPEQIRVDEVGRIMAYLDQQVEVAVAEAVVGFGGEAAGQRVPDGLDGLLAGDQ